MRAHLPSRSLQLRLVLAFLAVALAAVAVLGVLVGRAASGAFVDYLAGRPTGGPGAMGRMMEEMMGPGASRAMLEQMVGPAERAYLASVEGALWLAGGVAGLLALGLGLLLARRIVLPLRALTAAARRLADGRLDQRVPVPAEEELGALARAFNALAEALARQEALRRQMAADIAHELRTPLAVMQADLEALLDGVRPLTTDAVAEIHRETRLLARLVADLRDLSLAEAGQLRLARRPTPLGALARESVARFAARAEACGIHLALQAGADVPPADVDPDRLVQVLGNLLDNALRHTPPGGDVAVRVGRGVQPGTVLLAVRDTGPGIPPEHLPSVFERFYRADPARSRAAGGSGIGLALVKQLVEAHGGRAWAENGPGGGASFGVQLPAAGAR